MEKEADKGNIFNMQQMFNTIVALFNSAVFQEVYSAPNEGSHISSTTIENNNLKITTSAITTSAIASKEHLNEEQELIAPMIGKISKDPVCYTIILQM